MENVLYGLCGGLVVAVVIFIVMSIRMRALKASCDKESARLRQMLTDRMELESEGLTKLKKENEELKKANENLRISIQTAGKEGASAPDGLPDRGRPAYTQQPRFRRCMAGRPQGERGRVREDLCRSPGLHTQDDPDPHRCSGHRRDRG